MSVSVAADSEIGETWQLATWKQDRRRRRGKRMEAVEAAVEACEELRCAAAWPARTDTQRLSVLLWAKAHASGDPSKFRRTHLPGSALGLCLARPCTFWASCDLFWGDRPRNPLLAPQGTTFGYLRSVRWQVSTVSCTRSLLLPRPMLCRAPSPRRF